MEKPFLLAPYLFVAFRSFDPFRLYCCLFFYSPFFGLTKLHVSAGVGWVGWEGLSTRALGAWWSVVLTVLKCLEL